MRLAAGTGDDDRICNSGDASLIDEMSFDAWRASFAAVAGPATSPGSTQRLLWRQTKFGSHHPSEHRCRGASRCYSRRLLGR